MTTVSSKRWAALARRAVVTTVAIGAGVAGGGNRERIRTAGAQLGTPGRAVFTSTFETKVAGRPGARTPRTRYQSPRFPLKAMQTYDLVIVPSFPENRVWDVRVRCDDGNGTRTSYFY